MESDGACFVLPIDPGTHVVGCRLRFIRSLTAIGALPDDYIAGHARRSTDFLSCLMNPRDERYTYDLRIVAEPDPGLYTRGSIELGLLCRIAGGTAEEAEAYGRQIINLLNCYFPESEFEAAGIDAIETFLRPFEVGHLCAITRRASLETLDTLRGGHRLGRTLGFTTDRFEPGAPAEAETVYHIFPFVPTGYGFNDLFRFMLQERTPVAMSFRLRPTSLTPGEQAFIEEQIARCEKAAQVGIGRVHGDLSILRPTLQEQARIYQRYQGRLLFGLKDNAALLSIEVASPSTTSPLLVDALGNLVTHAAGMAGTSDHTQARYLCGGYDCVDLTSDPSAVAAFHRMDTAPVRNPLAPRGAERLVSLFDSLEAMAAFRLPPSTADLPLGIAVRYWCSRPAPKDVPEEGTLLGISEHGGARQRVRIAPDDRRRHVYVVGQTGTGKTTLLKTMVLEDIRAGKGLCVVDPHGDLFREILGKIPEERIPDVVVLDPRDADFPVGLNLLDYEQEEQRHFIVQEFIDIVNRIIEDEYGATAVGDFAGPVFVQHVRMNLLLAMSDPGDPGTLLEFYNIFQENDYWRRWLPLKTKDPLLEKWVTKVLPSVDFTRWGHEGPSLGSYLGSKFDGFVFDPLLRNIFGQKRSRIDFRKIMDEGKILLVNLAKGDLTATNTRFFGMILMARIMASALTRIGIPETERRDFNLYVDEFQAFATQGFITLLSEARKFGVSLVLANQFISQIKDTRITEAIFGNVGTVASFRIGHEDAGIMERLFLPAFNRFDLSNLPNWHAYIRMLIRGESSPPFCIQTLPDATPYEPGIEGRVRSASRIVYARERSEVEADIERSMKGQAKRKQVTTER